MPKRTTSRTRAGASSPIGKPDRGRFGRTLKRLIELGDVELIAVEHDRVILGVGVDPTPSPSRRRARTGRASPGAPRRTTKASAFDALVRSGLVGAARGLPRDLSTNPKHMEGFGGG